jgi:hypothetical protein
MIMMPRHWHSLSSDSRHAATVTLKEKLRGFRVCYTSVTFPSRLGYIISGPPAAGIPAY